MRKSTCMGALVVSALMCCRGSLEAQGALGGRWEGTIRVMGTDLGIVVTFDTTAEALAAKIDIPQQAAIGLSLRNVNFDRPRVHFELPAPQGTAVFDGEVDGDSIAGSFTQAGVSGTFSLRYAGMTRVETVEDEPPPYQEEGVTVENEDVTLACTLTSPPSDGPHPAVVMITGSGAQNRDEEIVGFRPFRIIADHLTRYGISVLRCDDRGVGRSTGSVSQSTSEDLAGDVLAGVRLLRSRSDIDPEGIGLVGHSEGGIIAPIVASRSDEVAFIVLMAGTAVTGEEVMYAQSQAILHANGASEAQLQQQRETQQQIFHVVQSGEGWDQLEADLRGRVRASIDSLPADQRAAITNVDAAVDAGVTPQLRMVQTPWFKFFLDYDPSTALEQVKVPVLALFGELDLQVLPDLNRDPMEAALLRGGNQDYTIQVVPDANHLFQAAQTGNPSEYALLEKQFVPGFLDMITEWILERVGPHGSRGNESPIR